MVSAYHVIGQYTPATRPLLLNSTKGVSSPCDSLQGNKRQASANLTFLIGLHWASRTKKKNTLSNSNGSPGPRNSCPSKSAAGHEKSQLLLGKHPRFNPRAFPLTGKKQGVNGGSDVPDHRLTLQRRTNTTLPLLLMPFCTLQS